MFRFRREVILPLIWVATLLVGQQSPVLAQQVSEKDRATYRSGVQSFLEAQDLEKQGTPEAKRNAIKKYKAAAALFKSVGVTEDEANSLNAAANLHDELAEKGEAMELYLKVADLLDEVGDRHNLALTLARIGIIFRGGGRPAKALEYFTVQLAIHRELKDERGEAIALSHIGNTHDVMGDRQKAIETHNAALAIRVRIGDKQGELVSLGNLGATYIELGEYEKALGYLTRSLVLAKSLRDRSGEASALANIGSIYDALGDNRSALAHFERALELARADGNKAAEGDVLNNIATIYLTLGEHRKARDLFLQAFQLRLDNDNVTGAIGTMINIGYLYGELGENDRALEFFNRAIPLARKAGDKLTEAEALHNIGSIHDKLGEWQKALNMYYQALPLRQSVGDNVGEARTLSNMMSDWNGLGNRSLAVLYGKQAVNRFQVLRSAIRGFDPSVRARYLSTIEDTYRELAGTLIALGRIAEAEEVLKMLKEEEVFNFQRRDDKVARDLLQTSTLTDSERAAVMSYDKFANQITSIAREYGELDRERLKYDEGKFPKQARLDELAKQRSDALLAFQKYLEQLKVEFARSTKEKEVAHVDSSMQATLREIKADRTAVVSTIAGEKRLNIIVTTSDIQRAHTVDISEEKLNELVANFRMALTSPANGKPIDPRPAGQKLYDILVKPIEQDLAGIKADTIVWSLDGTLRYLPMAAIWDKQHGYLAERFANSVVTLASRDRLMQKPATGNWTALGAGVSAPSDGFSALAAVPDELDCIVTDSVSRTVSANPICPNGVLPGRKLLDEKFNEAAFRAALGRYSVLHLATHFKLVPGSDNESFLLFGGGEDRRFTLTDLDGISLTGVELLALSACDTATPGGTKVNGVEIEGFGAIAQKVGARAVMATLWPVADPSTRDFMIEFYRRFGTGTEAKAESIRQAQIKLMRGQYTAGESPARAESFAGGAQAVGPPFPTDKKAPYAHPYYWAPFILFGNWR